jgi:hypothetical protein
VSWSRLQTPKDCIPQPWQIYAKCFSSLRCCGGAYGYVLMPYYMCWWGWILGKMGYGRACMMLRCHGWGCNPHWLHPPSILDVYKVFKHLEMLWRGIWVRTYAVLHVQVGVNFRKNGEWPRLYDVAVSWLWLQTPKDCIPHPCWMYTKCLSTLRCCGWAYGTPLCL